MPNGNREVKVSLLSELLGGFKNPAPGGWNIRVEGEGRRRVSLNKEFSNKNLI